VKRRAFLVLVLFLGFVGWLERTRVLAALGGFLVLASAPEKADIAVVLAGDSSGNRILKGAELEKLGYVPLVLVSGPGGEYDLHECDLAIPFAVKRGYPASYFGHAENESHSTVEEAAAIVTELRRRNVHKMLLITSSYHTRRATAVYRRAAPDMVVVTVAAPDDHFTPDGWWRDREGRKTFLTEWEKNIADWLRL
jgi:uncharacterized SAM-binding protein YcdF (DUF218 family)